MSYWTGNECLHFLEIAINFHFRKQAENKFELFFIDMKVFTDQAREDLYKTIPTTIREHYFASLNTIPNYFNNIYTYLQVSL